MILIKQDIRFTFHARRNVERGHEMESGSGELQCNCHLVTDLRYYLHIFVIVVNYDILFSEVDDMNSARQINYGKSPFIEKLYDEVIWDMMTLVGQIYFDFF